MMTDNTVADVGNSEKIHRKTDVTIRVTPQEIPAIHTAGIRASSDTGKLSIKRNVRKIKDGA